MSELRPSITPGDLAYACWAYEAMTDYAKSWSDFREAVHDHVDLKNVTHCEQLFDWLNQWGCRITATPKRKARVTKCLGEWHTRTGDRLPDPELELADASDDDLDGVDELFDDLVHRMIRGATSKSLRFGPTATSKTLFALRPRLFPAWDGKIRQALVGGEDFGEAYVRYVSRLQDDIRRTTSRCAELGIACRPEVLRPGRNATMAQLMGEYYWVTATREVELPSLRCRRDWAAWSTIEAESVLPD